MSTKPKKRVQLTDLVSHKAVVEIQAGEIEVGKIGAGHLARLLINYPALQSVGGGKGGINVAALAKAAPDAIPEIISLACGTGDDGIAGAESLDAADQISMLAAIFKISFPKGVPDFLERIAKAMAILADTGATKA